MTYHAEIVHHVPGRVRIRVPDARGNRAVLEHFKQSISPRPGVRRVDMSPATGSIVIHYDSADLHDFERRLRKEASDDNLFLLGLSSRKKPSGTARTLEGFFKEFSEFVKGTTGGTIDLRELFPFAVASYAFFFIDRSIGAPLWLTLMIFSFSAYMDLHEPPDVTDETNASLESLRAEIAALRRDIRALSARPA